MWEVRIARYKLGQQHIEEPFSIAAAAAAYEEEEDHGHRMAGFPDCPSCRIRWACSAASDHS